MRTAKRTLCSRPGLATVELAITLPLVLILLIGVWEVGRLIQARQVLFNAAREGARIAAQGFIINQEGDPTSIEVSTGSPNVENTIRNYLRENGLDDTGLEVTFVYEDGETTLTQPHEASKGQLFRITAEVPFSNVQWSLLQLTDTQKLTATVQWRSVVDDPFTLDTELPTW